MQHWHSLRDLVNAYHLRSIAISTGGFSQVAKRGKKNVIIQAVFIRNRRTTDLYRDWKTDIRVALRCLQLSDPCCWHCDCCTNKEPNIIEII